MEPLEVIFIVALLTGLTTIPMLGNAWARNGNSEFLRRPNASRLYLAYLVAGQTFALGYCLWMLASAHWQPTGLFRAASGGGPVAWAFLMIALLNFLSPPASIICYRGIKRDRANNAAFIAIGRKEVEFNRTWRSLKRRYKQPSAVRD